jgi:hypothetical protein
MHTTIPKEGIIFIRTSKPTIMQYLSIVSYYKLREFLMTDTHHANDCSFVTSLQTSESVTILLIYPLSVLSMYLRYTIIIKPIHVIAAYSHIFIMGFQFKVR